jgi:hypothetical protein
MISLSDYVAPLRDRIRQRSHSARLDPRAPDENQRYML